jgi:hypothetical protein
LPLANEQTIGKLRLPLPPAEQQTQGLGTLPTSLAVAPGLSVSQEHVVPMTNVSERSRS